MSNPTRIGQEAPDLKAPSSPSRITPTRALDDDAEKQMTTLGINIRGAGSLFRNDMDSTIERRARGDDDDESFHTASALTPSSIIMASLPA